MTYIADGVDVYLIFVLFALPSSYGSKRVVVNNERKL